MLNEQMAAREMVGAGIRANVALGDRQDAFATARITHRRPVGFNEDGTIKYEILNVEEIHNVITNVGRAFIHQQSYGTSGLGANGLNYIALSNDAVTETSTSTVLSNEIVANGLSRAQGAVVLATGAGTVTTVDKTFTCTTTSQACQKAALFTAASVGTMNHVLGFTQRTLQVGDQIDVTFSLTIA